MLLFGRGKAVKLIEEGLVWKAGGTAQLPGGGGRAAEGLFIEVPVLRDKDQLNDFIAALGIEAGHVLRDTRPKWMHLRGAGVSALDPARLKAVVEAVCPGAAGVGLDLNPRLLGPGDIAGYRSAGVERFCFRMESPYDKVDDPVRRARAMGAFASVEVCFSDELNWLSFLHAVGRALESAPAQVSIVDERWYTAAGNEQLEAAGGKIVKAGYKRLSLWSWAKADARFDRLAMQLTGRGAGIGPDAFTCCPSAYRNPGMERWLETRLARDFEIICADGALEQGLALASGLYALELRRAALDGRTGRQAAALARLGIVDKQGRPLPGRPMEFCHKAARMALLAMMGGADAARQPAPGRRLRTPDAEGMSGWKTGSGES